ncbi:hypothetical protein ACTFIY_003104 [Dictyostelium cf. discoideum]
MNSYLFRIGSKTTGFLRSTQFVRSYSNKSESYKRALDDVKSQVATSPCVLYMKGIPERPECGFSNTAVRILQAEGAVFTSHNVLKNDDLREAIKEFGDWPTIPQLYVNGEFVGGADILMGLYKTGELSKILSDAGVVKKD